jgi:demethylmenaquinone methyltransferase/2-methoxy-6-polyprenyl-1,4-benzoquinol methylase
MADRDLDGVLREQIAYYRARAAEYDEWFLRRGRYDRGVELNAQWFGEIAALQRALAAFDLRGRVLELACGTGLWTRVLAETAYAVTAVDSAPEAIALNRERLRDPRVSYEVADVFSWRPETTFDAVFFGFWLSHVPPERFAGFWRRVGTCLKPGGRVVFLDSLREASSTAVDHAPPVAGETHHARRLNDGRTFTIVKVFYQPESLERALAAEGWEAAVRTTGRYFLFGEAIPRTSGGSL